jgi:hypothetical protein
MPGVVEVSEIFSWKCGMREDSGSIARDKVLRRFSDGSFRKPSLAGNAEILPWGTGGDTYE